MSSKQLYELQVIDLEIEAKQEALSHLQTQLGADETLDVARQELSRGRERLRQLQGRQKELEWEVEGLVTKIRALDEKLYGGSVRSPKELASLQQDVESLKTHQREMEDEILNLMEEIEKGQRRLEAEGRELQERDKMWREEQERLAQEVGALGLELERLEETRGALAVQIDSGELRLYETLRVSRQGKAVAKVERGMCQGCRINLPMIELQRLRTSQDLVQCSSCGRILYLS